MGVIIFLFPFAIAAFILWDSQRRLGRYCWGWAAFAFISSFAAIGQIGKDLQAVPHPSPKATAGMLGGLTGAGAGVFTLYRMRTQPKPETGQPPNTALWLYGSAAGTALIGVAIILRAIRNRAATQSLMFENDLLFFDLGFIGGAGVLLSAVLVVLLTRRYAHSR